MMMRCFNGIGVVLVVILSMGFSQPEPDAEPASAPAPEQQLITRDNILKGVDAALIGGSLLSVCGALAKGNPVIAPLQAVMGTTVGKAAGGILLGKFMDYWKPDNVIQREAARKSDNQIAIESRANAIYAQQSADINQQYLAILNQQIQRHQKSVVDASHSATAVITQIKQKTNDMRLETSNGRNAQRVKVKQLKEQQENILNRLEDERDSMRRKSHIAAMVAMVLGAAHLNDFMTTSSLPIARQPFISKSSAIAAAAAAAVVGVGYINGRHRRVDTEDVNKGSHMGHHITMMAIGAITVIMI